MLQECVYHSWYYIWNDNIKNKHSNFGVTGLYLIQQHPSIKFDDDDGLIIIIAKTN